MGQRRNKYRILMDKPEERRAIGRPRCACTLEGTTQIDLEKNRVGGCGMNSAGSG
jgi:hypothetical protein